MNIHRPSFRAVFLLSLLSALPARADDLYFIVEPAGIPEPLDIYMITHDSSRRFFTGVAPGSGLQWSVDTQTGTVSLAGLYDSTHLLSFGGYGEGVGWMIGLAIRADEIVPWEVGSDGYGFSAWMANPSTGQIWQVGLYDSAHALPNEAEGATGPSYLSLPIISNASGHTLGYSINNTTGDAYYLKSHVESFDPYYDSGPYGTSVWMADGTAETVTSTRFGLYDAAHTMPAVIDGEETLSPGGFQMSEAFYAPNENGDLAGYSLQFGEVADEGFGEGLVAHFGVSLWVGRLSTGLTHQVGLTDARHTSALGTREGWFAFVFDATGNPSSSGVTSGGVAAGASVNHTPEGHQGLSAWVATFDSDAGDYVTTRVGFFGDDAGGIYRDADGCEESEVLLLADSGLAAGYSMMLTAPEGSEARSTWVVNTTNMELVEVGLMGGEYQLGGVYRRSELGWLNNDGRVAGYSTIFHEGGESRWEEAAWVQKVASPLDGSTWAAERIGLALEETSTWRANYIYRMTGNGVVYGNAEQRLSSGGETTDAWIATRVGTSHVTAQVGLTGGEFSHPLNQSRASYFSDVFANGVATGESLRYYAVNGNAADIGESRAAWIAKPLGEGAYQTFRVGLHDAFHTSPSGEQLSVFNGGMNADSDTAPRYFIGLSDHYSPGGAKGQSAWAVDIVDGVTRQLGILDERHTRIDGTRSSQASGVNSAGYVWGESTRYTNDGVSTNGSTAWVYAFSDHSLHRFDLWENLTGFSRSEIHGVTEDGVAYGSLMRFDAEGNPMGLAAFGWTLTRGVFLLEERVLNDTGGYGWTGFEAIYFVSENGKFIGLTDDGTLFFATLAVIPEPASCVMLIGLAGLGAGATRRRRRVAA
jgi:hypothetical protein